MTERNPDCDEEPGFKNNPAVYECTSRIRYSEVGHNRLLTPPALIDLFQDCSLFHSEQIGFGPAELTRQHAAWVLSHWYIVADRYPEFGETVTVGTFATSFRTVSATRNFYLLDSEGNRIACANSIWAFIDLNTGKPQRPSADHVAAYGMADAFDMPAEQGRHIAIPSQMQAAAPITVLRDHIDTNEHMNNCQYIKMALEVIPHEMDVRQLRVDFKRSALLGDVLYPFFMEEPERSVVVFRASDESVYGVVECVERA